MYNFTRHGGDFLGISCKSAMAVSQRGLGQTMARGAGDLVVHALYLHSFSRQLTNRKTSVLTDLGFVFCREHGGNWRIDQMHGVMVVFRFDASPSPFSFTLPPSELVSALLLTCPNLSWGPLRNVCPFICRLCVPVSGVSCRCGLSWAALCRFVQRAMLGVLDKGGSCTFTKTKWCDGIVGCV